MTTPDIAEARRRAYLAEASQQPELATMLNALADELERLRAQVAAWETELSAVMPADFKDWHQNSKAEWPAVAAAVIRSQREDRDLGWEMAASAQVAPAGWKLVPRQPTEEMMNAGLYQSSADTKFEDLLSAWFDMFDAAPAQQAEHVPVSPEQESAIDDAMGLVLLPPIRVNKSTHDALLEECQHTGMILQAVVRGALADAMAQPAPSLTVGDATKFACWDADNGLETFDTQSEALEYANETLREYRKQASFDGEWTGDVESMWVGAIHITHKPATTAPDEEGGVDYKLQPTQAQPAAQAEPVAFADGENPCVLEWGAVSLPMGDPSRVTEMKLCATLWEAIAEGALCGFDWRVYPMALKPPAAASQPAAQGVGELPPLPKARTLSRGDEDGPIQLGYTADQMCAYARAALAQAPAAEPLRGAAIAPDHDEAMAKMAADAEAQFAADLRDAAAFRTLCAVASVSIKHASGSTIYPPGHADELRAALAAAKETK